MRSISQILQTSAKSKKYGELLFRISNYLKADNILELGTSLGISTAYMAAPRPKAKITSVEACANLAKVAKINFDKLELNNIQVVVGHFDDVLEDVLDSYKSLDLVFIDGNHREEASLRYFERCLEKCHSNSIIILDDIYWSKGMTNAWEKIKEHPKVTVSIDLFEMGLLFFREQQAKEHFTIRH